MMLERAFHADWEALAETYRRDGALVLKGAVDPVFMEYLEACLADVAGRRSHGTDIAYQAVPECVLAEFARIISTLTGEPLDKIVLVNNWFMTYYEDFHTRHIDDYWEQHVLLIMMRVPKRADGKESVLQLFNRLDELPGKSGSLERHRFLREREKVFLARPPCAAVRLEAGDAVLANVGELYHERLLPNGTTHFRLGAHTHGADHPINRDETMIYNSSPVPPHPVPEAFRARFPEVAEPRRYHVAAESPAFQSFWARGPSLGFRCKKRWSRWQSRGQHILRRLSGRAGSLAMGPGYREIP